MTSLRQILSKTFFWAYERGTWQYDVAVILILVFVLATPRNWFRDQPEASGPAAAGQVQLVSKDGSLQTYRVDARVLTPPKFALQSDLHTALQQALLELRNGNFSISRIEPVRDEQGLVIAYQVEIRH